MLIHFENENLKDLIKDGKVIVDFFATWCGPCQMAGPVLEEIAKEHSNIKVIKIDIDKHEDIAREYGVMSVPTFVFYEDGNQINRQAGFMPKDVLLSYFN